MIVEGAATAGLVLALAGATAPIIEIRIRGFWGYVTSWEEILAELVCLCLSLGLSLWAIESAAGLYKGVAVAGAGLSAVALVAVLAVLIVVLALALVVPWVRHNLFDLIDAMDSGHKTGRRKRRSRRR